MVKKLDFYSDAPYKAESGDFMPVLIVFHISHIDHEKGEVYIQAFRTGWPVNPMNISAEGVPQGSDVSRKGTIEAFRALCPSWSGYEVKVF